MAVLIWSGLPAGIDLPICERRRDARLEWTMSRSKGFRGFVVEMIAAHDRRAKHHVDRFLATHRNCERAETLPKH
jgi:hypothetical protein